MLTAVVITKNEEKMIEDCLKSLKFVDKIIVVDTGNTDHTNVIAKKYQAKIIKYSGPLDYSAFRNAGDAAINTGWIVHIDADERVTPQLAAEIQSVTTPKSPLKVYALPRKNIYLGKELKFGGWGGDYVTRLYPGSESQKWSGVLHEQPQTGLPLVKLTHQLVHISHRDLSSMLQKTLIFTAHEAQLRFDVGHPPMTWWRFFRVMGTEFWLRFVKLSAWRDGPEGVIDGIFQVFNTFIIYARLWEMQHHAKSSGS